MATLSTERFSSRVEAYVKYRPHYPKEVIYALREKTGLRPNHIVADVGSGTGFSTELFLENGNFVYAIEPNGLMREAGEKYLATYKNFRSLDATAEATTLPDSSVDYIVAGQAFHWFDLELAHTEFNRILRPGGWVVILWNDRETDTTPFLIAYEQLLLRFGTDYTEINHRNVHTKSALVKSAPDANIQASNSTRVLEFFHRDPVIELQFENNISMDFDGLKGRLVSSSYVPAEGDEKYQEMIMELQLLFDKYNEGGKIDMRYQTLLFAGQLFS